MTSKPTPEEILAASTQTDLNFAQDSTQTLRGEMADVDPAGERAVADLTALGERSTVSLHGTLGVGGMAVVRQGRQMSMDRDVAVKTLRADRPLTPNRIRLLQEAWLTGQLEHPNVVPVHDVRVDQDGSPQIVMKQIEGEPWSAYLDDPERLRELAGEREPLVWHVGVLMSVCNAVSFAHSRSILHRDIKPDNVMIGVFGEVTLLDWGIAVGLDAEPTGRIPRFESGGSLVGTLAYMAPEMLTRSEQTVQTDVFLLGAVLYEVLAGHPPHLGGNLGERIRAIMAPKALPPGTPPLLEELCLRALAQAPAERPASAAEFRAGLQRFMDLRAVDAIVHSARSQLEAAREAIASQASRREILDHLSSCRFGFSHALSVWPEHDEARQSLDESLNLAAGWAIGRGEVELAAFHLDQAERPDDGLRAKLDEALEAQQAREAKVQTLLSAGDPKVEAGSRSWAGAAFMLVVTALTVGLTLRATPPGYLAFFGTSVVLLALGLGAMYLWRTARESSVYSRGFIALMVAIPAIQSLADLGAWLRGWPPSQSHGIVMLLLAAVSLTGALVLDRRAIIATALWGGLWLLSSLAPDMPYPFMAAGAGLTMALAYLTWKKP